ncbi:MAG: cardiolipin synthase [Endomicrobium sp.]|jgi:cardiolipin synthase|nr:cardiolipin synthase [Endomicrobium sp.]
MKKVLKFLMSRLFIVSLLISLQLAIVVLLAVYLADLFLPSVTVLNVVIVTHILNRKGNLAYKTAWIIPVLLFPVSGTFFYLLFGWRSKKLNNIEKLRVALKNGENRITYEKQISNISSSAIKEINYLSNEASTGAFRATETSLLHPGEKFFKKLFSSLESAEKFIFLEYFIIEKGQIWDKIFEILLNKAERGVEIRLMFDDIGSISKLPKSFQSNLREHGIKTAAFNPFKPSPNWFLNYRNHRKYAIIDGKTAFTGGINIADEYAGIITRFGFWEDACVMLHGDAVDRMTVSFLQIWHFTTGEIPDYACYITKFKAQNDGLVVPFSDEPILGEYISVSAYLNLIEGAKKYIYICTPYLILDDVMVSALVRAAKSGIDVKIITPGIPDKKIVFCVTRSNYNCLIKAGVKIYEFTPGFLHTKSVVADDLTAILGTANFDFRSFYLHFEDGVWLHKSSAVLEAKEMFLQLIQKSERISDDFSEKLPIWRKLVYSFLKIFAPLM